MFVSNKLKLLITLLFTAYDGNNLLCDRILGANIIINKYKSLRKLLHLSGK